MRAPVTTTLLLAAVLAAAPASAGDPAALVATAIEAHGGAGALSRLSDVRMEGEATYYFGGGEIPGSVTIRVRDGRMLRRDATVTFRGSPFTMVEASNGADGWQERRGRVYDYPVDDFDTWLAHRPDILLRAAAHPDDLTWVGHGDVDGVAVETVEFAEPAGTTRIMIGTDDRRVVGLDYEAELNEGMGTTETALVGKRYAEYRDVDGVPFPHRQRELRDGVPEAVVDLTTVVLGETPPADIFDKPAQDETLLDWGDQLAN